MKLSFSERIGIKPLREIQINNLDNITRISLWNIFLQLHFIKNSNWRELTKYLWIHYYNYPIDEIPKYIDRSDFYYDQIKEIIKETYIKSVWHEIYSLIEIIINYYEEKIQPELFKIYNREFDKNKCNYRFIDNVLSPITNEIEINEIEQTLKYSHLPNVNMHIKSAIRLLSDRENPEYRNSIKESISAVEALCNRINQKADNTSRGEPFGQAINNVKEKIELNSQLVSGFHKIFGYTNNPETGIRHWAEDVPDIQFEDAKYFLVTCSAFINYLVFLSNKADIKL